MTKHDQERRDALLRYIAKVELQITKEYGKTCQLIGQIHELRKAVESNGDFAWEKHPEIRNKMHVLLDRFARRTANTLTVATSTAYDMGLTDGANKAVEAYSGIGKKRSKSVKDITTESLNKHREGSKEAHAYATAKRGGLTISDRVWNLTKGTEKEIEICVQNAILQGGDAAELSREIRGYLNNPKALFRRVRNPKTGNLELSKAAQNYHPGQGVYRSAYLNAMRLTRTEINQAYRTAETAGYADNPLITGYRIRLSDNHTTLFKGKRIPLVDICDYLAGEYPATFKWNGWHPQCRCIIVPNTLSEDDLDTLIQARGEAIKNGEDPSEVLPGLGRNPNLPDNFVNWYADNEDRIKAAKYRPLWLGTRVARRASAQIPETKPTPVPEGSMSETKAVRTREEILAAAEKRHNERTAEEEERITTAANKREAERYFDADAVEKDIQCILGTGDEMGQYLAKKYDAHLGRIIGNMSIPKVLRDEASKICACISFIREGVDVDKASQAIAEMSRNIIARDGAIDLTISQHMIINMRQMAKRNLAEWGVINDYTRGYIGTSNSFNINGSLADYKGKGKLAYKLKKSPTLGDLKGRDGYGNLLDNAESVDTMRLLDEMVAKTDPLPFNVRTSRMLDNYGAEGLFNLDLAGNPPSTTVLVEAWNKAVSAHRAGKVYSYTSLSSLPEINVFKGSREFRVEGIIQAGQPAIFTTNIAESEIIMGRGLRVIPMMNVRVATEIIQGNSVNKIVVYYRY